VNVPRPKGTTLRIRHIQLGSQSMCSSTASQHRREPVTRIWSPSARRCVHVEQSEIPVRVFQRTQEKIRAREVVTDSISYIQPLRKAIWFPCGSQRCRRNRQALCGKPSCPLTHSSTQVSFFPRMPSYRSSDPGCRTVPGRFFFHTRLLL
jgi:hypothetical protein